MPTAPKLRELSMVLSTFLSQVSIPDQGQEIVNRVFIGGLARDVSYTSTFQVFSPHFDLSTLTF